MRIQKMLMQLLILMMSSFILTACPQTNETDRDTAIAIAVALTQTATVKDAELPVTNSDTDANPATDTPTPASSTPVPITPTSDSVTTDESLPSRSDDFTGLPAPLYFIDETGQIMRLEKDGTTLSQITDEAEPVDDFAISPTDGRLIYISGNDLIESTSMGEQRTLKVTGNDVIADDPESYIAEQMTAPYFSPDGELIAFGLNGINLISIGEGAVPTLIQPSDPYPDINNLPETQVRFFSPGKWSPDGSYLMVNVSYWPEAGGIAIKGLGNDTIVDVTSADINVPICCDLVWRQDSQSAFIASDMLVYGVPGLSFLDVNTGMADTIIQGPPQEEISGSDPLRLFRSPYLVSNDELLLFVSNIADLSQPISYVMHRVSIDGTMTPLRSDDYELAGDSTWAKDGSGIAINDIAPGGTYPFSGQILWLAATDAAAVSLPVSGRNLQWGLAEPSQEASEIGVATAVDIPDSDEQEGEAEAIPSTDNDMVALISQATADLEIDPSTSERFEPFHIMALATNPEEPEAQPLWLVHSTGLRNFDDPGQDHVVALYTKDESNWTLITQLLLSDGGDPEGPAAPDYLSEGSVEQVRVEPAHIWFEVMGGLGAHSGSYHLLSFDGDALKVEAAGFSSSPGAGYLDDINGDGIAEVLLDATDHYVFCYACSVKEVEYTVMRWNGAEMMPLTLDALPDEIPAELRALNDRAITLVDVGLWKDAHETINEVVQQTEALGLSDDTLRWNANYIKLNAELRQSVAEGGLYPLLENIFYGDYQASVELMRSYTVAEIFNLESPLFVETVAENNVEILANRIIDEIYPMLKVSPDIAATYYLNGWANWLLDPDDPSVLINLERAANLVPDDALYVDSLAYITDGTVADSTEESPVEENVVAENTTEAASITPSGERILYSSGDGEGRTHIYSQPLDPAAEPSLLVEDASQPALRADGQQLAFYSTQNDSLGLASVNLSTGERVRQSGFVEDRGATWSPDGGRLAFGSSRESDRNWRLYLTPAGMSDGQVIGFGQDPDWHPSAERLVFKGCDESGGRCGLWTMNADGSDPQPLTDNPGDAQPQWSPDGSSVVFMSDQRDGNWEIYQVNVATQAVFRLTTDDANDGHPSISPDGNQVAFISDRGALWQLWIVSLNGGDAQPLAPITGVQPNWLEQGVAWVR